MLIFLYGEDSYRSSQKLQEIIESYKKTNKDFFNLKIIEVKEAEFADFRNILLNSSLFAEKKLIILKNVFSNSDFTEKLNEYLKNSNLKESNEEVILVYQSEKFDKRNKLFKELSNPLIKSQEFEFLTGEKLKSWILKLVKSKNAEIEMLALQKLIDFVGSDSARICQEIDKLINYLADENPLKIKRENVEMLVFQNFDQDIFKTIDAFAEKDKKKACELIYQQRQAGCSDVYIISMLIFQFRNLLLVKSPAKEGEKLKMHPFVLRKTTAQSKMFSFNDLKKIYLRLFEFDKQIKTGKIKPEIALDLLMIEI